MAGLDRFGRAGERGEREAVGDQLEEDDEDGDTEGGLEVRSVKLNVICIRTEHGLRQLRDSADRMNKDSLDSPRPSHWPTPPTRSWTRVNSPHARERTQ